MARPISSYSIEASSIDSAAPTESRASAVAPLAAADSDASSDDENGSIVVSDLQSRCGRDRHTRERAWRAEGCPLHLWDDTYAEGRWVSERRRRRKSRRKFPAQKAKISHFLTNSSSQDEISAAFDPPSRRMWWILRRSRAAAFLQFVAESGHRIQACASVQAPRGRGHSRVQHEAGEHLCAFLAVHQPPGHVHQVRFHLS